MVQSANGEKLQQDFKDNVTYDKLYELNMLSQIVISKHIEPCIYSIETILNDDKEEKYDKIANIAKREANRVLRNHFDVQLDPMTPDERRIVHNTLSGMEHIKTESTGVGANRAVSIKYVE